MADAADLTFLQRAVDLARRSITRDGGGPFGALIVHDGQIIGEGWNQVVPHNDPTAHAEVVAIRNACSTVNAFHLPKSTLYASSEPCPMCLAAAYWAHIPRIVYANPRAIAAEIGFSDDALYRELGLPHSERQLCMEHLHLTDADRPLRDWFAASGRIAY